MTAIIFIIVLSILIFVHELGHFLIARLFKIRVDEFAIGFPPKLFSFKKGATTYAINLIPLGGYVKIHGENPEDGVTPDSILSKPRWQQALVLVAGVTFNAIFAFALFTLTLMIGSKAPVGDFPVEYSVGPASVMITSVSPKSPADVAGLKAGDEIIGISSGLSVNGSVMESTMESAVESVKIQPAGTDVSTIRVESIKESIILSTTTIGFLIKRGDEIKTIITTPVAGVQGVGAGKKGIGISMSEVATVKLPLFTAISAGFSQTVYVTKLIAVSTYDFLGRIFTGNARLSEVSGPVGIAGHVGEASRLGFTYLAEFAAFISLNLAVLNLLPIPALDGGRLLFVAIEAIRRKPLNPKFTQIFNTVSFLLLILLMLFVTFHDVFVLVW